MCVLAYTVRILVSYNTTDLEKHTYNIRGLSKTFVQYVYKNVILQILGYINVVKILPIRHNTFVPPPFPLLEAPLEFLFS